MSATDPDIANLRRSFETDCGHVVRYARDSVLVSRRQAGALVDRWPYMLLRSCPACSAPYVWLRPLADVDDDDVLDGGRDD